MASVPDDLIQRVVPESGITLLIMVEPVPTGGFMAQARWMPPILQMSTHDNGERRRTLPLFTATADTAAEAIGAVLTQLAAHHVP